MEWITTTLPDIGKIAATGFLGQSGSVAGHVRRC